MIGSINGYEWVALLLIALIVIGPERLPGYAKQLGNLVRELRRMARGATARVREEVGPEIEDLTSFDPRQYDPRRIIRDALSDDAPSNAASSARPRPATAAAPPSAAGPSRSASQPARADGATPFDDEAT